MVRIQSTETARLDPAPIRYDIRAAGVIVAAVIGLEAAAAALPWPPLITTGLIRVIDCVLICAVTAFYFDRTTLPGLFPARFRVGLLHGIYWTAGFGAIAGIVGMACYLAGIDPLALVHVDLPAGTGRLIRFFAVGGIIGPAAEELFFRGVLYGVLRRLGVGIALILSTLLFVLAHSGGGIAFPQIVGGLVFAAAYEYEKNLIVPIVIHICGNLALFCLGFF